MIPNPLHPAIVHFPIVFLLLGTACAFFSICFFRKDLIVITALIFILGTTTVYLAMQAGTLAADQLLAIHPLEKDAIEAHATSATWVLYLSIATTILALVSIFSGENSRPNKTFRVITCIIAIILSAFVLETAKRGGHIVYQDLLKINTSPTDLPPVEALL